MIYRIVPAMKAFLGTAASVIVERKSTAMTQLHHGVLGFAQNYWTKANTVVPSSQSGETLTSIARVGITSLVNRSVDRTKILTNCEVATS
jgi:hypothetical protein